jgi:hypothetical protein
METIPAIRDPQKLKGRLSHALPLTGSQRAQFEIFWSIYPKKTRLPAAERAWSVINPTDVEVEQILRRVERAVSGEWRGKPANQIPAASRWLKDLRWC